jgi:CSLREA domain-containing protein
MVGARRRSMIGLAAALLALGGLVACDPAPPPTTFTVNRFADGPDADPGDGTCEVSAGQGDCSLRAAVAEGNATDGPVRIGFVPTDRYQVFGAGTLTVSSSMTITGPARVSGRVVHNTGDLVLRDLDLRGTGGNDTCGTAVRSDGGSLGLDRVHLAPDHTGQQQPMLCASGPLAIVDSMIDGFGRPTAVVGEGATIVHRSTMGAGVAALDVSGAPSFTIANATVDGLHTGDTPGDITSTWLVGEPGPETTVRGSILECRTGSAPVSGGYNLDIGGTCGLDHPTDEAPPTAPPTTLDYSRPPMLNIAQAVGSPVIDAIPVGTPVLCDGTLPTDQKGAPRPVDLPCDIGPLEYQSSIVSGPEEARPVVHDRPIRVNASGTVAATFPGEDGAPDAVGRWEADGTFTSSGIAGSAANDIADDGTVVGFVTAAGGSSHAWRWHPDGTSELVEGPDGTAAGSLVAIDDDGTIVGDSGGVLWWQAPSGEPVVLPSPGTWPRVTAVRNGIAVGLVHEGEDQAAVWDLAAGTGTRLADFTDHPDVPPVPTYAFDVTVDGTVLGEIDGDVAAWPGGGAPTLVAEFTSPLTAGVVGSLPIVVGRGNIGPESSILYVLGEHATDVRLVIGLDAQDLGDGGHLVGTRRVPGEPFTTRQVVRLPLTITP